MSVSSETVWYNADGGAHTSEAEAVRSNHKALYAHVFLLVSEASDGNVSVDVVHDITMALVGNENDRESYARASKLASLIEKYSDEEE